jgi:hypothetical protein
MTSGIVLGIQGAERAAANAGTEWKERAFEAFARYASGSESAFLMEDVRAANPSLPAPPDLRAWGQVARRASKAGLVKWGGYTKATDPKVHGNPVSFWEPIH